jgi:hypothetical protein
MSKMNPEVKARWVAALRSGKYAQGAGALRKGDCFCCLGVLCDVLDPDGWENDFHQNVKGMPSLKVYEEAGFAEVIPGFRSPPQVAIEGDASDLDVHNDNGRTFAEIADAIEEQL